MKLRNCMLALAAGSLMVSASTAVADNHESDDYMLNMTIIDVKPGHMRPFREGMTAYNACYSENGGERSWSVWNNVTGSGDYYYMVSRMDAYAEMDEQNAATMACWSIIEEQVAPHVIEVESKITKRMGAWSAANQDVDVVELHHFRVAENSDFRAAVGAITAILSEAEYEHQGVWYEHLHNSSGQPDYFVVESYDNFAAMDEERSGAYRAVADAEGEERADELWADFRASLTDDWAYRNEVLRRVPSLAMTQGDD
ncbi:MAG: hypothetical protein AAGJ52_04645 [Pseudomonadota bacterium]